MRTFDCPSCGAQYGTDQVEPGTLFTCGSCDAEVTAPKAATPSGAKRPHTVVRSTPPNIKSMGKRKGSSKGAKQGLLIGGALVLVGAIVAIVISNSGGGTAEQGPGGENAPPTISAEQRVNDALQAARADNKPATASEAFDAYKRLQAVVEEWVATRVPGDATTALRKRAFELRDLAKDIDPNYGPYREERGDVSYGDRLASLVDADFLDEVERKEVRKVHESLSGLGAKDHGWIPTKEMERAFAIEAKFDEKIKANAALKQSPFFTEAQKMIASTVAELDQRMSAVDIGTWQGVEVRIVEPYVFFVQKDAGWDALQVALSRSAELIALQDTIIAEYPDMKLKAVDRPVPVLYFRNHNMYQQYAGNVGSGALAHFEPMTGRMAIHDSSDHTTRQHEGTHQLMWFWTERDAATNMNPGLRSYWFQEGIAEWYSSSSRTLKPDGTYEYQVGLLEAGRMASFGMMGTSQTLGAGAARPAFNLKELIQTTYGDRERIGTEGRTGYIYAQGWFLVYFLNHYNVDNEGYVVVGAKGKYADRYRNYMRAELAGDTGLDVFMKQMELDEDGLRAMSDEYWRYAAYINRKVSLKQVDKKKRLVAWDKYVNQRGEFVGEKEDDRLPELPDYAPKPW